MHRVLLGVMVLAVPCFIFLLGCGGVVPLGVVGLWMLSLARYASRNPAGLVPVVVLVGANTAIYVFIFYKLATLLTRTIERASQTWRICMLAAVGALAAAAMLSPISWFECTHWSTGRCTAFAMYFDWHSRLGCGALGW
jgi:hypothetical protein